MLTVQKIFGKNLPMLRRERGWTQEDLARHVSEVGAKRVSKGGVARWEGLEIAGVSQGIFAQMADAFEISQDALRRRIGAPDGARVTVPERRRGGKLVVANSEVDRLAALAKAWGRTIQECLDVVIVTGLHYAEQPEFVVRPAPASDVGRLPVDRRSGGRMGPHMEEDESTVDSVEDRR